MCKKLWSYLHPDDTILVRAYERKAYYFWNVILINVLMTVTVFIIAAQVKSLTSISMNETRVNILPFRLVYSINKNTIELIE
jgi:hypothetical protein